MAREDPSEGVRPEMRPERAEGAGHGERKEDHFRQSKYLEQIWRPV